MSYKGTGWIEGDEEIVERMIERQNTEWAARQERAAIVRWLRTNPDPIVRNWISAQIEAGEHHGKATE